MGGVSWAGVEDGSEKSGFGVGVVRIAVMQQCLLLKD